MDFRSAGKQDNTEKGDRGFVAYWRADSTSKQVDQAFF